MEIPLFLVGVGIFVTVLVLFRPMSGLILMILYISLAVFPTVAHSLLGIFTHLTMIKLLGGLTFGSMLIHNMVEKKNIGLFQTRQARFFLLFLLWIAISGFSQPGVFTRELFTRYGSFAILFCITICLVDSPARVRMVLWSCIISMLLASSVAIFQHFSAEDVIRAKGTFSDSNYFCLYLLPIIPVAFYRASDERLCIQRVLARIATIALILAVIFTFSRGGMIGLAVVLFLLALKSKRKLLAILILGIIITIFVANMPDYFRERIEKTKIELEGEKTYTSTYRRLLLVKGGWKMFLDKPLTGVGIGNFFWSVREYTPVRIHPGLAHNMYIEVLAELGLIGMFLFMGIIFLTLRDLRRIIKMASFSLKSYAQGLYVGLIAFLVSALFLHAQYEKFFWLFIFLTICLKNIVIKKEEVAI